MLSVADVGRPLGLPGLVAQTGAVACCRRPLGLRAKTDFRVFEDKNNQLIVKKVNIKINLRYL